MNFAQTMELIKSNNALYADLRRRHPVENTKAKKSTIKKSHATVIYIVAAFGMVYYLGWGFIPSIIIFVLFLLFTLLSAKDWGLDFKQLAKVDILSSSREIIINHIHALVMEKRNRTHVGTYGEVDDTSFLDEVQYFLETIVRPKISAHLQFLGEPEFDGHYRNEITKLCLEEVAGYKLNNGSAQNDVTQLNPIEFERWCADKLTKLGWKARATQASGDQGADVVAQKGEHMLVVQCKLYSQPVGNKAVQEISAARAHYGASLAAVVTTAGYTKSAVQLAHSNKVVLLDYTEMDLMDERLGLA